ncbi:MAG TPA: DUF2231 domain-containing protein [Pseudonocardiaceae bacterium]
MEFAQGDLITVDGLPLHPLVVHAVVVLLPLAAVGGLVIALRAAWRRRFWVPVLVLTVLGVGAVPVAARTGEQLQAKLPPQNQLIQQHADLGRTLLPFAIAFGVTVILLVLAGRLADRERDAADTGGEARTTWRRVAIVAAALVAFTGVACTVQVLRVGHSGSTAVWDGVGQN